MDFWTDRLHVLSIVFSIIVSGFFEHVVDTSLLQNSLSRCQNQSFVIELQTLTERHFSYCSNIGLHSSVVAAPLKNSGILSVKTCD